MPQATREIKRRIKSIKSTRQITKAMEMVSVVKMRKAVDAVLRTRRYSALAWEIVRSLSKNVDPTLHPLLVQREVKNIGLILITSNRGLCAGFNSQMIALANEYMAYQKEKLKTNVEIITLGKRGKEFMFKRKLPVFAEFNKADVITAIAEVLPLAKIAIDEFIKGKYDKIVLAYTDYISNLVQMPRLKPILPVIQEDEFLGQVAGRNEKNVSETKEKMEFEKAAGEYVFEPSTDEVLSEIMVRLIEIQIYQAVLESNAAEHAARMVAMKNATEAADDMIDNLVFSFNQARQATITKEIAEIAGGKIALEKSKKS